MFFEEQLKNGVFQICYCRNCNNAIWPPKEICHICNNKVDWKKSINFGKILEFSKKESKYFGLIEIDDGIRILGDIISTCTPKVGQLVRMEVSFNSKPHYSFFIVENN
jgi:uncharacterized OB-fold protein